MGKLPHVGCREIDRVQLKFQRTRQVPVGVEDAVVEQQNPVVSQVVDVVLHMKPFPPWVGQFEIGVRPTELPVD